MLVWGVTVKSRWGACVEVVYEMKLQSRVEHVTVIHESCQQLM